MAAIEYTPLDSAPQGFDEQTVAQIVELAESLTPVTEIAALIDYPEDKLRLALTDKKSPLRPVYIRAKSATALKLRKRAIELALGGAREAIELTYNYLRDMAADEDQ